MKEEDAEETMANNPETPLGYRLMSQNAAVFVKRQKSGTSRTTQLSV